MIFFKMAQSNQLSRILNLDDILIPHVEAVAEGQCSRINHIMTKNDVPLTNIR